jgi:hypothetical protein
MTVLPASSFLGSESADVGVVQLSSPSVVPAIFTGTLTTSELGRLEEAEGSADCLLLIPLPIFCLKLAITSW